MYGKNIALFTLIILISTILGKKKKKQLYNYETYVGKREKCLWLG